MKTGRHGFSILELLVVVGIIAALTALAVPYYQDYLESSRRSVMEANFRAIRKAVMEYHADTGDYPDNLQARLASGAKRYLMEIPVDPEPSTTTEPVPADWGYVYNGPATVPSWGAKYQYLIK